MPKLTEHREKNIQRAKELAYSEYIRGKKYGVTMRDIADIFNRSYQWVMDAINELSTTKLDKKK